MKKRNAFLIILFCLASALFAQSMNEGFEGLSLQQAGLSAVWLHKAAPMLTLEAILVGLSQTKP